MRFETNIVAIPNHRSQTGAVEPLLTVTDVSFAYRKNFPVVQNVSFTLAPGKLVGLIGDNGAGKTTLVKLIRGDIAATSGTIEFTDPRNTNSNQPDVAVVEQHLSLFPDLSVAANICTRFWASKHHSWITPPNLSNEASRVIRKIGYDINLNEPVRSFTYPVRQMVEVARAVYQGAKLFILDEPTAALDSQSRRRLLDLLRDLTIEGATVLLVTHDMDDLREVADEVMVMRNGYLSVGNPIDSVEYQPAMRAKEPKEGAPLSISVALPSGKPVRISGYLGKTSVWHFDDSLDRSLTAQRIAFPQVGDSCRVESEKGLFDNPSTTFLRSMGIKLLLSDRLVNGVFPELTVIQNYFLLSGLTPNIITGREGRAKVEQALRDGRVSYPSLDSAVSTLSGGNQQRLLWRAAADSDARFIVAEEPLWGLDPEARRAALDLMKKITSEGRSIIVLTCFPRSYPGETINRAVRLDK